MRSNLPFFALFAFQLSIPSGTGSKQRLMEGGRVASTTVTKTFVGTTGGELVVSLVTGEAWTRQEVFHRIIWTRKEVQLPKKGEREMPYWKSGT